MSKIPIFKPTDQIALLDMEFALGYITQEDRDNQAERYRKSLDEALLTPDGIIPEQPKELIEGLDPNEVPMSPGSLVDADPKKVPMSPGSLVNPNPDKTVPMSVDSLVAPKHTRSIKMKYPNLVKSLKVIADDFDSKGNTKYADVLDHALRVLGCDVAKCPKCGYTKDIGPEGDDEEEEREIP